MLALRTLDADPSRLSACRWMSMLGPTMAMWRERDVRHSRDRRLTSATVDVRIDSDGVCERVVFADGNGEPGLQLCLLPDSDFLAWEYFCNCCNCFDTAAQGQHGGPRYLPACERLWRRCVQMSGWTAAVVRVRCALAACQTVNLSFELAPVSAMGRDTAQRLAESFGIAQVATLGSRTRPLFPGLYTRPNIED